MEGLKLLELDTTAMAVVVMDPPDKEPNKEEIDKILKPQRSSVIKLTKVERPCTAAVYELEIDGVG